MKVLVIFGLAFALVSASVLPNKKRYEYTKIVIDNLEDNVKADSLDTQTTNTGVMALQNCVNGFCDFLCKMLGWSHGQCFSADTCRCYN